MRVMCFTVAAGLGDTRGSLNTCMMGKKQKHASQAPTVPEPSAGGPRHLGKIPCNPQQKTVMCNRALFLKLGLVKPLSIRMLVL